MQISIYNSPLGPFYLWFHDHELVHASFRKEQGQHWLTKQFPKLPVYQSPLAEPYKKDLDSYFLGQRVVYDWPLQLYGTEFQLQVWQEIKKIPYGQFTTYKKIGQNIGTKSFSAVGQAVGANPISIIIPCHRVLGTNWLGGYGGGQNLKRLLLELENVTMAPNLHA